MDIKDVIKDLSILRLRPGDTIVLRCEGGVDEACIARLRQSLTKHAGFTVGVLAMGEDDDIGVIRSGEALPEEKTLFVRDARSRS